MQRVRKLYKEGKPKQQIMCVQCFTVQRKKGNSSCVNSELLCAIHSNIRLFLKHAQSGNLPEAINTYLFTVGVMTNMLNVNFLLLTICNVHLHLRQNNIVFV